MLQWFRVRASRIAAMAMLSMAAVGGSAVLPHEDDCHGASCSPAAVAHDAAAHRVGAPPSADASHPLHCVVCHWVRAFRPRTEARIVSTLAEKAGVRIAIDIVPASAGAPAAQPPLRSPPASPVLA